MKWVLRIAILLVIVVIAVLVFMPGPFVKPMATKVASNTLKVPVTMDKLSASLFGGRVGLAELEVGNPEGYSKPFLVRIGGLDVQARLMTFMGDVAEIPTIVIDGLHLIIESKGGKTNVNTILDNLSGGEEAPTEEPKDGGEGMKFKIGSIMLKNTVIEISTGVIDDIKLSVTELELKNIGTDKENGANLKEVLSVITKALAAKAVEMSGALSKEIQGILKDGGITDGLNSAIEGGTEKVLEGVKDPINKLFNR